ncbi:glyoxalase [Longimycelium tulufanense]|uniref:Glyoxalase n=1 Tax=Longimycelium tulufanense TaxID=907463 RepID=A0A8J3C9R8_9PSEU|nr:VOC family protein [Longimycelium tulufanense]GGM40604.1 glyoxalase [Longimycelium tulufanense]
MSVRTSYAQGTPCWIDLSTGDRRTAMDFYHAVLGWDYEVGSPETGYYTQALVDGKPVAAIYEPPPEQPMPTAWMTYLATDDATATARAIPEAGGQLVMDAMNVMEFGRMVLAVDPSGATFGAWQAGTHIGMQVVNQPGAVVWNELASRNAAAARRFYSQVFGVGIEPPMSDLFDYTTFRVADRDVGGIMTMDAGWPADLPSHWQVYFGVRDTDVAVRVLVGRGGTTLAGPQDSPYGRMAVCSDPEGALFSLIAPPPEGW